MRAVTLLQVAEARGITEGPNGGYTLGSFDRVGLPMLGGCKECGACIAAYNACPSRTGYLMCANGCIGDRGFPTVKAFEAWCKYTDALQEAAEEADGLDAASHDLRSEADLEGAV